MKLKMQTLYANEHRLIHPGEIADFPAEEGRELLEGRYAVQPDNSPEEVKRHNAIRRSRTQQ